MIDLSYRAALTRNFLREFKKLPKSVKDRISRAVDEIVTSPFLGVELRAQGCLEIQLSVRRCLHFWGIERISDIIPKIFVEKIAPLKIKSSVKIISKHSRRYEKRFPVRL